MDADERSLLATTVAEVIATTVAEVIAAADEATAIDGVLADLGWLDLLAAEPDDAIDIVFHALGRTNAHATVLDDVVVQALGFEPRADLAVLLPSFGSWEPPGSVDDAGSRAHGIATARISSATDLVVVYRRGSELCTAIVPTTVAVATPVRGIDPAAGLHVVEMNVTEAVAPTRVDAAAWDTAVAHARRGLAHQLAGASRAMLDLARAHAIGRVQFGRPVAQFQAVRHRLADALVAVEAVDAALQAAADEPAPLTAALAKAIAGRTAATVATHCQQVLAGIGFTTDHPFHRFLKRTIVLDGLFGSADDLVLDIGRGLLATGQVPTLVELS